MKKIKIPQNIKDNKWWIVVVGVLVILLVIVGLKAFTKDKDIAKLNKDVGNNVLKLDGHDKSLKGLSSRVEGIEAQIEEIKKAAPSGGVVDESVMEAIEKNSEEIDAIKKKIEEISDGITSGAADGKGTTEAISAIKEELAAIKEELDTVRKDAAEKEKALKKEAEAAEREAARQEAAAEKEKAEKEKLLKEKEERLKERLLKAPVPPYEEALIVEQTEELFAESPDCGNTKWNRSSILVLAKKKGDDYPYYLVVTLPRFKPGMDDEANAKAFDDKARRIRPGKQIRIVSTNAQDNSSIYPGLSRDESEVDFVKVKKIGDRHMIFVPISLIEVIRSRTVE